MTQSFAADAHIPVKHTIDALTETARNVPKFLKNERKILFSAIEIVIFID